MPKATESNTTNRRAFLATLAAAIPAAALATGTVATLAAAAEADPIYAAIEAHRAAADAYQAAQAAYEAANRFEPDDLSYRPAGTYDGPTGQVKWRFYEPGEAPNRKVDCGFTDHDDFDRIAQWVMAKGERERLHAALDENTRMREVIDRLEVAAGNALDVEREAAQDLVTTVPTTMRGILAALDYFSTSGSIFAECDFETASGTIGSALRNITGA